MHAGRAASDKSTIPAGKCSVAARAARSQRYRELLRDPRWQKRRLEKLQAAKWKCERCKNGRSNLQVHHRRYVRGRMPWEYKDAELMVECEGCHALEHLPAPTREELDLEERIDRAHHTLVTAKDSNEKRMAAAVLSSLVLERSPAQRLRMERDRGLR
jgi:hypothetical protein